VQAASHVSGLPVSISDVQGSESLQLVGQDEGGSQVSPGSIVPSPHVPVQSESVKALQPGGQHPSPPVQAVMGV